MATLADSLVSSSARRLPMRRRPDLSARRQRYQGRSYWVVKEPVGLNYFRFQEEEYAILQMIDGQTSLDDIKERFEAEFPPEKITVEELQQFIGTLHGSGLVISDVPGQGYQLKKRRDERRRKEILGSLTNILSIRFKGYDPERLLNWMHPYVRWIYSRLAVFLCLVLAVSALILVAVQFDVFQSKLPTFHQFFSVRNAIWMAVALGATKVVHEFGHGMTCKHFGGECHEMGVMLLVLTPCLYCNVSDSWMLPSKWQRAAIGAAGMYVEIVIASVCTFIWWFSEPGMLNHLALSTMFVCSVSTLLFNGNPLLRYDGYYILMDLIEIPNLRQKATDILSGKLGYWCLGLEQRDDPFLPQRNQIFFAFYSVAAACYRWFVVLSILWFLHKVFEPYHLEIIGQAIASMSLVSLIVMPLWKVGKFFYIPGRIDKVKKLRLLITLALLTSVVLGVTLIRLPYHVMCVFEVKPLDASSVFVDVPGQLLEVLVSPGDRVQRDDVLARLRNIEKEQEIADRKGQRDGYVAQLENLHDLSLVDESANAQIQSVEESLKSVNEMLATKEEELRQLTLKSPTAGMVMPPPSVPEPPDEDRLPGWTGTPFQGKNRHCRLEVGTLFCYVGDPAKMQAELVIDQGDIKFVEKGQRVELILEQMAGRTLEGKIDAVATTDLAMSSRQLSTKSGGELATKTDKTGAEVPISASFPARVALDNSDHFLRIGLRGRAKIHAGSRTLGQRIWRYFSQTFNFRW